MLKPESSMLSTGPGIAPDLTRSPPIRIELSGGDAGKQGGVVLSFSDLPLKAYWGWGLLK